MNNNDNIFLLLIQAAILGVVDLVHAVHTRWNTLLRVEAPRTSIGLCTAGARLELGALVSWAIRGVGDMVWTVVDSNVARFGLETPRTTRHLGAFVTGSLSSTSRGTGMFGVPFEIVMVFW